jgi:microcystin-dependent protein
MAQPYIGEIRMFAGTFAPSGWSFCQGQILAISGNEALFNLIGTTYGGDGQQTFALPNLASRVPIHQGSNGVNTYVIGQNGGTETVTLNSNQMPSHTHIPAANSGNGGSSDPTSNFWAASAAKQFNTSSSSQMAAGAVATVGGAPHDNMLPYLAINFIIALNGVYPSQN